jgi:hypothetical protein
MRRNTGDRLLRQYAVYSLAAHLAAFALGLLPSLFEPKKDNLLLMDIEIASEGELKDVLVNQDVQDEPKPVPPPEEVKPVEEIKQPEEPTPEESPPEQATEQPDQRQRSTPEQTTKEENPPPPPEKQEEIVEEEKPAERPDNADEQNASNINTEEEPTLREEPAPGTEKNSPPEIKKKPKKRNRKALLETIKRAEKKKIRERNRKKMLEITEKAISQQKKNSAFDKMLGGAINDLKRSSGKGSKGSGGGSFGQGNSLTDADYEVISSQIYPHWVVPSGVRDAENIIIEMRVQLRENGEVIPSSVKILDEKKYATDYVFRAAADSARRAILEASPLKISKDKIELFRDFILRFNIKEALGGYGG